MVEVACAGRTMSCMKLPDDGDRTCSAHGRRATIQDCRPLKLVAANQKFQAVLLDEVDCEAKYSRLLTGFSSGNDGVWYAVVWNDVTVNRHDD
jgi:hypothetical protein